MELVRLTATDFCLLGSIDMELRNQGLVWVGGVNRDSDSAKSNGAGKTTLFKAITWVLYGQLVGGKDGDQVIREGTKVATVGIELDDGEDVWMVERVRRKAQPKLSLTRRGDKEAWPGSRKEVQAKIDEMMGMDFQGWRNTVLYAQGDKKRFTDPETKDADRKELLHGILRTNIYAKCHEVIRAENLALKREHDAGHVERSRYVARVEENDLEGLEESHASHAAEAKATAKRLAAKARELLSQAKESAAITTEADALEAEAEAVEVPDAKAIKLLIKEHEKTLEKNEEKLAKKGRESHAQRVEIEAIEKQLKRLGGDECPTCTAKLSSGAPARLVKELKKGLDVWNDTLAKTTKAQNALAHSANTLRPVIEEMETRLEEAEEVLDRQDERTREVARLRAEAAEGKGLAKQAREKAAEAKEARDAANPYTEQLETMRAKVAGYEEKIAELDKKLANLAKKRAHYEFWVRGFSGQGLPSFVLDSVMPFLTERANHYLEILADGDITMSFSTQRELTSSKGEMRDEIAITWSIEGADDFAASNGQLKKMELATGLALMDLVASREGTHPDILLLDEVLDGLDAEGRHRVVRLLYELRKNRSSVFVVSHDEGVAESFERTVEVIKEDGVSRLVA